MFPVIKSDYWSSGDEPRPPAQSPTHASAVYSPIPQHAVPLMYTTAPVTIHHAPHSTYNNNNANPSTTFLDRVLAPPPPPYENVEPHRSLEYTTVYDKPALDGTLDTDDAPVRYSAPPSALAPETRIGGKRKRTTEKKAPLLRRFGKSTDRKGETSTVEAGLMELTPLKTAAIIDTFEEIEDGLTDSLSKEHGRAAKSLLKCGRVSVRTLKRLLIALVAVSAVYTAGTQLFDGTKLDEFASDMMALAFPSSNRSETGAVSPPLVTSDTDETVTPAEPSAIADSGLVGDEPGPVQAPVGSLSWDAPEKPRDPFKIVLIGVSAGGGGTASHGGGDEMRAAAAVAFGTVAEGTVDSRGAVVIVPASPVTETDIVAAPTDGITETATAVTTAITTDADDFTATGQSERNATTDRNLTEEESLDGTVTTSSDDATGEPIDGGATVAGERTILSDRVNGTIDCEGVSGERSRPVDTTEWS